MMSFVFDLAPPQRNVDFLLIIAVVAIVIAFVAVVAVATGILVFIRLRRSRASAIRADWAAPESVRPAESIGQVPRS